MATTSTTIQGTSLIVESNPKKEGYGNLFARYNNRIN